MSVCENNLPFWEETPTIIINSKTYRTYDYHALCKKQILEFTQEQLSAYKKRLGGAFCNWLRTWNMAFPRREISLHVLSVFNSGLKNNEPTILSMEYYFTLFGTRDMLLLVTVCIQITKGENPEEALVV